MRGEKSGDPVRLICTTWTVSVRKFSTCSLSAVQFLYLIFFKGHDFKLWSKSIIYWDAVRIFIPRLFFVFLVYNCLAFSECHKGKHRVWRKIQGSLHPTKAKSAFLRFIRPEVLFWILGAVILWVRIWISPLSLIPSFTSEDYSWEKQSS